MSKVILITGGAVRIGAHISEYFASLGWNVAIHYNHSEKEALALVDHLNAKHSLNCNPFQADFSHESDYQNFIPKIYEHYGRFDAIVHNASLFEYDTILSNTRELWDKHMETNLRAPFVLSQQFAKLPQGTERNIIFMLDQRVWNLTPHFTSYTLTKTALWSLTQILALSLAPNIRVNGIGPGPVLKNTFQDEKAFQRQWEKTPLASPINPLDIARTIQFILDTPSLTGQMIALDGGQHLGWSFPETQSEASS